MSEFEVIYLTGAPATGKTSVVDMLQDYLSPLIKFSYGRELTRLVNAGATTQLQ